MSGFGIRAFKKRTTLESKELKKIYFKHIVMGENIWAALTYLKLVKKHGASEVKLISPNVYDKHTIINELRCSPSKLRDEYSATLLRDLNIKLEVMPRTNESIFYKDSKFHDFDGRAKPLAMLDGEEYFSKKGFDFKLEAMFSDEEWNDLDETLANGQENKFVSKITRSTPSDLVEKSNFILTTGEVEEYHCEKLYYTHSPRQFYKLVSNKDALNDELAAYCSSLEEKVGLSIHFEVDREIHDKSQTVFLPQSQTHEWGHFIIDFDEFNPALKKQTFKTLMFIDLDEVNEEELAKKVRLLKRSIERIFPELQKARVTEHIHFDQEYLIQSTDDFSSNYKQDNSRAVIFEGPGAPTLKDNGEWNSLLYDARAIAALFELE